jgi:hypothetical protein
MLPLRDQVNDLIHNELRHRGEPLVAYPGGELWKAVGGSDGVSALIQDLYRRIEQDELLREVFPHFNSGAATISSPSASTRSFSSDRPTVTDRR